MSTEHERRADYYVEPRYPVDEPPTWRARCGCGWTGPERYKGITDADWAAHQREASSPAADPGLRDKLAEALLACLRDGNPLYYEDAADECTDALLPVVAAYVEQQARERAAVELEAAADEAVASGYVLIVSGRGEVDVATEQQLRARAAALRGQA